MSFQEKVFTFGNIVAGHFSLDYNTTPVQITNEGTSELTINAGDPLTADGIAESATGLLGLATEFRIIKAGETDEILVLDANYGFGVRLNESMLPETITAPIKTALIGKGFKFLS
jgi:hypothetical protein